MSDIEIFKHTETSDIHKVADHLLNIGVNITAEEIQILILHQYKQQQYWQRNLYKFSFIPSISNGKIITTIVGAALGFFLAPVFGIGAIAGILIGASIGWKIGSTLFPEKKKLQTFKEKEPEKVTNIPGFDSVAEPPAIGGVVPMIFAKFGGVQVRGNVLFSRVFSIANSQRAFLLVSLGLGKIKNVNVNKALINGQPLTSFNRIATDVILSYTNGENNAAILGSDSRFNQFYSQAVSVSTQKLFGFSFISKNTITGSATFQTADVSILNAYTQSGTYRVYLNVQNNQNQFLEFNVSGRDVPNRLVGINIIKTNPVNLTLNNFTNTANYVGHYEAVYRTQKKCSSVEVNFNLLMYGINSAGVYFNHGLYFQVWVDNIYFKTFFDFANSQSLNKRCITIRGLNYDYHTVVFIPFCWSPVDFTAVSRIDGYGNRQVWTSTSLPGSGVVFETETAVYNPPSTLSGVNSGTMPRESGIAVQQLSSDSSPHGSLTTVNEITYPGDLNQSSVSVYPNQVVALIQFATSDRITGQVPTVLHYVEEGIIGKSLVACGTVSPGSTTTQIVFTNLVNIANWTTFSNLKFKNIDQQLEANISSISGNTINLSTALNSTVDDRFYIYYEDALGYFPDVYVHTLTSTLGGLGKVITDRFIDFPSVIKAKQFCITNNYYYDDIIDNSTSWNEWASLEATASLLLPSKYGSLYGLVPEQITEPVAIFTASNIIKGSFQEYSTIKQKVNAIQLTYRAKEGNNNFYQKTISVSTTAAFNNNESYYPEAITFDSITNETQAIKVAQVALKSRIIQDKVIEFYTGIQGFYLREADLIYIQYGLTELQGELSGFCLSANTLSSGTQTITLSTDLGDLTASGKTATIYHLQTGNIQKNKSFSIVNNQLVITGLSESIKPPINGFSGDVIIINSNLTAKIFRISSIDPEPYKVKVTAVYWNESILDTTGIVTVGTK